MTARAAEQAVPGFDPDVRERILAAINERLVTRNGCMMCGNDSLTLVDSPMYLSSRPPNSFLSVLNIRILPCVVLVCDTCGYVHMLAISRLGLGDLLPSWLSE